MDLSAPSEMRPLPGPPSSAVLVFQILWIEPTVQLTQNSFLKLGILFGFRKVKIDIFEEDGTTAYFTIYAPTTSL